MKLISVNANNRTWLLLAALLLLMMVVPLDAFASEAGTGMPYEAGLKKLKESITGPVAFTISIIGVVAAGAMLIFGGDMNGFMRSIVFLVLVIGLIISASSVLTSLFGEAGAVIDGGVAAIAVLGNYGIC